MSKENMDKIGILKMVNNSMIMKSGIRNIYFLNLKLFKLDFSRKLF
jgi:hypothetical protein